MSSSGESRQVLQREQVIEGSRRQWLGHVLRMTNISTISCSVFSFSHEVEEAMRRSVDGVSCLVPPWLESKDPLTIGLETPKDIAANRQQWRSRCHLQKRNAWKICIQTTRLYSVCHLLRLSFIPPSSPFSCKYSLWTRCIVSLLQGATRWERQRSVGHAQCLTLNDGNDYVEWMNLLQSTLKVFRKKLYFCSSWWFVVNFLMTHHLF